MIEECFYLVDITDVRNLYKSIIDKEINFLFTRLTKGLFPSAKAAFFRRYSDKEFEGNSDIKVIVSSKRNELNLLSYLKKNNIKYRKIPYCGHEYYEDNCEWCELAK